MEQRIEAVEQALYELPLGEDTPSSVWQLALDARYALAEARTALQGHDVERAEYLLQKAERARDILLEG